MSKEIQFVAGTAASVLVTVEGEEMRSEYGYETYLVYSNRWQNWPRHINWYREPPQREYESARVRHAMDMLDSCLLAMFEARAGIEDEESLANKYIG